MLRLPLRHSLKLIKKLQEEETREYVLKFYLADRPNMTKDTFRTFNEYLDEMMPKKVDLDNRTEDEIMEEILQIENKFRKEE